MHFLIDFLKENVHFACISFLKVEKGAKIECQNFSAASDTFLNIWGSNDYIAERLVISLSFTVIDMASARGSFFQ